MITMGIKQFHPVLVKSKAVLLQASIRLVVGPPTVTNRVQGGDPVPLSLTTHVCARGPPFELVGTSFNSEIFLQPLQKLKLCTVLECHQGGVDALAEVVGLVPGEGGNEYVEEAAHPHLSCVYPSVRTDVLRHQRRSKRG